jgi:hypothetical protein
MGKDTKMGKKDVLIVRYFWSGMKLDVHVAKAGCGQEPDRKTFDCIRLHNIPLD